MTKSIPCGLLAFAVSSSLLFAQGDNKQAPATAGGWTAKPGSGLTFDGGDAFSLRWVNRMQIHWIYAGNENLPDTNTFLVRRLRTTFEGHVFDRNVTYQLTLDGVDQGASGGAVKYAWAQWNFNHSDDGEVGLRAGQDKSPYGLESQWTSGGLWFVERASATRWLADSFTRGAWIKGRVMAKDHPIRFSIGAQNTDVANGLGAQYTDRGEETNNSDNELTYVLSANFDPLGDFHDGNQTIGGHRQGDWRTDDLKLKGTVGAGLCLGNGKDTASGADINSTSFNLNTAWTVEHWNILAEYFLRQDDPQGLNDKEKPSGFAASLGYLMNKSGDSAIQWGFGIRYSLLSTDAGGNGAVNYLQPPVLIIGGTNTSLGGIEADVSEITFVADAFYHGHACKTQFEWTIQDVNPTGGNNITNNIFRIGFQLEF
jgi:hypothetical protein